MFYVQATGGIFRRGVHRYSAYSGHGPGKNNPALEAVHDVGPIPRGHYRLGTPHDSDRMGVFAIPLVPVGHNALGRGGFYLHGDNTTHTASTGCIILSPEAARKDILEWGEELEVVATDLDVEAS